TWDSPLSGWMQRTFEHDVLPAFIPDRRWFADKTSRSITAKVAVAVRIEHADDRFGIVIVNANGSDGTSRYFLPLTIRWTCYTAIDRGPATSMIPGEISSRSRNTSALNVAALLMRG